MIAKKYSYTNTEQIGDKYIVEIRVDKEMIEVMQSRIIEEIKDTSVYISDRKNNANKVEDGLNYIKTLVRSYEDLRDCLEEIDIKQSLAKIPDDEDVKS